MKIVFIYNGRWRFPRDAAEPERRQQAGRTRADRDTSAVEQWRLLYKVEYSRTGWGRTAAGRNSGTWGCTGPGSTLVAPWAPHRISSYPASTSHMTPTGRPPISAPLKVSDTAGRKFWRFLSYFRVIKMAAVPRPSASPGSDRLKQESGDVTSHALAPPLAPAYRPPDRLTHVYVAGGGFTNYWII